MQQHQIDLRHIQLRQRGLDSFIGGVLGFLILHPDLCRDEQTFPCCQAVRDSALYALADSLLVHIGRRRIQQAVACGDGVVDDLFTLGGIWDLKDPEAFLGQFDAVAECQEFHVMFLLLDLISFVFCWKEHNTTRASCTSHFRHTGMTQLHTEKNRAILAAI